MGGRLGSLAANIRDLSSLRMAILQEWEEMMCHSRVPGCAERSLKLREAPISEGGRLKGAPKSHMVLTLGDPSPTLRPPVGAVEHLLTAKELGGGSNLRLVAVTDSSR